MRASMWVAEQLRTIGVKPAGQDGSYFQWWNMLVTRVSTVSSSATIAGTPLTMWKDIVPLGQNIADAVGPTVWVGDGSDSTIDVRGKIAVILMNTPPASSVRTTTNSPEVRYTQAAIAATTRRLQGRGAAAIVIIADSIGDLALEPLGIIRQRGTMDVIGGANRFAGQQQPAPATAPRPRVVPTPSFLVPGRMAPMLRNTSVPAELHVAMERFETPSCNIVGIIPGTDPTLRNEYVLYSSHQDHDGVRYIIGRDSVWAGADDNGSVSVAILASARAFMRQPAKRSILIVFHGAEEKGLLGSRYHAAHPVVPLQQIVAVLNGDMIGRNHPRFGEPARHPATAPQLQRSGGDGAARQRTHRPVHAGQHLGSADAPRRLVLPQRPCAVRAARCAGGDVLHQPAQRLSHTTRHTAEHRLSEADADDAVDVPDRLAGGQRRHAAGDRSRLPAGALTTRDGHGGGDDGCSEFGAIRAGGRCRGDRRHRVLAQHDRGRSLPRSRAIVTSAPIDPAALRVRERGRG
ncbi:MAG: M28 family peptidase [Gemmatimonadaceae bacterium]|nr:M28 family peptidase [Gemmatimonadaceae bacterium]